MSYENRVDFVRDYGRTKTNMMITMGLVVAGMKCQ